MTLVGKLTFLQGYLPDEAATEASYDSTIPDPATTAWYLGGPSTSSKYRSFVPNGIAGLTNTDQKDGILVNKFDLLCPKANCGSIILKSGVAKWVEQSSIQVNSCFPSFDINIYDDLYSWNLRTTQSIQTFHLSQCHQKWLNGG
jgi:hypothetical protein